MQFIDTVSITVISGSGGDGIVAWRREKYVPKGGPAGGDGGHGGNIVIEASRHMHTLLDFKYKHHFKAKKGENGKNKKQHGKNASNVIIKVPCGTVIVDSETGHAIGDLTEDGEQLMVAAGGRGGRGNCHFTSSRRQAPQFAEPGEPGIERELRLELKLIADVGLIGMPNAGKSTLISVISAAKPKIADYPFTTLSPNLGMVKGPSGDGIVVADIPGLIEGASQGHGLGHDFLRHVERTRLLLHLVDIAPQDDTTPLETYHMINEELKAYNQTLAQKPQMVVLTKTDLTQVEDIETVKEAFADEGITPLFCISAVAHQGVDALVNAMFQLIENLPPLEHVVEVQPDIGAFANDDSDFDVVLEDDVFFVVGGKIERLMRVTNIKNNAALYRTMNILKAMGVFKALKKAGVQEGQTVAIGGYEFEYHADDN